MHPLLKKRGGTARDNRRLRHRFHAKYVRFALRYPGFRRNAFLLPPKEHRHPGDDWLFRSDQSLGISAVNSIIVGLELYILLHHFPIRGRRNTGCVKYRVFLAGIPLFSVGLLPECKMSFLRCCIMSVPSSRTYKGNNSFLRRGGILRSKMTGWSHSKMDIFMPFTV